MKKLSLRIDVTKIDKTKIVAREYESNGVTVKEMNLSVDLVFLREEKLIKSTDTYNLVKVAFVSDKSTKKEDGTYENGTIIGEAFEYRDKPKVEVSQDNGTVNVDNIPF